MKIAVPVNDSSLDSGLEARFGRARGFILFNRLDGTHEFLENRQNFSAAQGAGIQSAALVANSGANALIAPHVGPKAHAVLAKAGVRIYAAEGENLTARQAINRFLSGDLHELVEANVEGHWG